MRAGRCARGKSHCAPTSEAELIANIRSTRGPDANCVTNPRFERSRPAGKKDATVPTAKLSLPCPAEKLDEFLSAPSPEVIQFVRGWRGNILVLGAGGKMGLHLCLMLHAALTAAGSSARVSAVSRFRTLRDQTSFAEAGISTVSCDLSNPADLAALPEAEIVYFLAGMKFGTAAAPGLLHTMNVVVPRLVAERFRHARIAAFSTGCVYPFVPTGSTGATEQTPVAPVGEYAESCLGRETEFAAASARHRTPVVLVRLNYSVEFRYGVLVDIGQKVLRHETIDVTMGHVNVIWQRDAIDQIIRSVAIAGSPAVPLNITGADVLAVRQIAEEFGRIFGSTPTFRGTEAPTAWLNDAAQSHRLLGAPATSVATMIEWIAAWLVVDGTTWGKPTGFEKRDGKF
jgi:nucleoside-diphosphate-sugar epimerase